MPSVREIGENIKSRIPDVPIVIIFIATITAVAFTAFSIGWIARGQADTSSIPKQTITLPSATGDGGGANLYVSSRHSDVFHYRWCSGAKRINTENKVYYQSFKEAVSNGLKPASNCPGLEARQNQ
jgi:hypothetical protein